MGKLTLILAVVICSLMPGCCSEMPRVEPQYPTEVLGWKETHVRGVRSLGTFVLNEGQATDNGRVQIKLLDLIPPARCAEAGTSISRRRAKFQFIKLPEQKVLCEDTFVETSSMTISGGPCGSSLSEFGILSINVGDINLKDGWAFFELRG